MLGKVTRQHFVGNGSYIKDDVTLTYWLKTVKLQYIYFPESIQNIVY